MSMFSALGASSRIALRFVPSALPSTARMATSQASRPSVAKTVKKVPTEVYPLIALVCIVSSYGISNSVYTLGKGDLRLLPDRLTGRTPVVEKQVWED